MPKKKRPSAGRGPEGPTRAGTTTTKGRPAEVPVIKPAPAEPGGPNRLLRKEEARRQRERLRRKMARRRRYRVIGAVLVVALVGAAIAGYVLTRPDPAAAAGCTPVTSTQPMKDAEGNDIDRSHIGGEGSPAEMPELTEYPSIPPASGAHNQTPLPASVYDTAPDLGQAIHSLEHGAVIIWYAPTVPNSRLQELRTFAQDPATADHLIMALYDYPDQVPGGELPAGKSMALVAWHRLQLCDKVSLEVAKSFVDRFRVPTGGTPPPGYPKDGAPEPGSPLA